MDRSFLSNEKVVNASRNFVCIRLATYEDKQEAEFLKTLIKTRSGELENTVFAILAPDGKTKLSKAGRGPHEFRNAGRLATEMDKIAADYSISKKSNGDSPALPYMKSFKLALNVASADILPLVAVSTNSESERKQLEELISNLAFDEPFEGQFVYAKTKSQKDMKQVDGDNNIQGIYLIAPDKFGTGGEILDALGSQTTPEQLKQAMQRAIAKMPREKKEHHSHVKAGIEKGVEWESEIPETDPQSIRARQRARGKDSQGNRADLQDRGRQSPAAGQLRRTGQPPRGAEQFVEHAMEFDADGNGQLSREELAKFAENFRPPGPPRGQSGPRQQPQRGSRPGNRRPPR